MPTYVYECQKCLETFEVDQRITEDPLKDCKCGGKGTLKRLIQPIAVMFKGDGFYVNDSVSKPSTAESPAKETSATPAPSEGTEATKPAATAE